MPDLGSARASGPPKDLVALCSEAINAPYEEGSSQRWIEVKPPKGDTYLVLGLADESTEKFVGVFGPVWFDCDDMDATYEELKAKGVEFGAPPSVADWNPSTRWAQFSDPDGNMYGISQG